MRLDKYLCDCNIGSRSEVKQIIKKKSVYVNDKLINDNGFHVSANDKVVVNGNVIEYNEFLYFVMNKPAGVVTAREDNISKTVMDLIDVKCKDLSPVGRLDKDTEGLLLITNNGKLNHNMLSPKKHVDKVYLVKLEHNISDDDILELEKGVDIKDDSITLPAKIKRLDENIIELTIHEGRFHQVKRMMEAVNNRVVYLKRLSFGPLTLEEGLKTGKYRELSESEMESIQIYM